MRHCILIIIVLALAMTIWRCGDFLEVYSQDLVYAAGWEDLDEVLIGNGYMEWGEVNTNMPAIGSSSRTLYYPFLFVLDDDVEELTAAGTSDINYSGTAGMLRQFYTWQPNPYFNLKGEEFKDETFYMLYEHIAYVNTIIAQVDEFPDDPIEERTRIRGEGQFLRAAYYFVLNNLYGHAYDSHNSGADWGVPVKTTEYVTKDYFKRNSVKEVYEQIIEDLNRACENLRGVKQRNYYRTNQLASRILLSRVYLYMENYDDVIEQCDSALAMGCPLSNLNDYEVSREPYYENGVFNRTAYWGNRDYLYDGDNPEVVFTMGTPITDAFFITENGYYRETGYYSVSTNLLDEYKYDETVQDIRRDVFFATNSNDVSRYGLCKSSSDNEAQAKGKAITVSGTFLIRTVEVYLNKAEAQAMKGDLGGAVATLLPFLNTRYAPGKLPQISSLDEEELVNFIRSERRRELCFEGHRWADLKRYAVNSKYPLKIEIRHTIYTGDNNYSGYYVLKPYGEDDGWILPFPDDEITFNDGELNNPARPDRSNADPAFVEESTLEE